MDKNNSTTASDAQNTSEKFSILADLDDCPLHRKTPFGVTNVLYTQLSIARYCGMINFNGYRYIYYPDTDELIREDVMRWKAKQLKAKHKKIEKTQEEMKWI
jgi:hypothetical protein